jgi:TP901 family phage tail tape measure protein
VQDFARFEKGMNEVFTLMPDITDEAMGQMTDDVKAFANETGTLPDEVIPALYNSLSAGVPRENVFQFLQDANKLAVAGASDVGVAVDALTSVTNAYGHDVLSAADASNILFTGVKQGKTTLDELSGAMSVVAPIAAGLGIGFDSVVSSMAAMTSQGEPTAGAATKLKALMGELAQPTSKIATLFQELSGQSFPDFIAGGGSIEEALAMIGQHAQDTGAQASTLANSMEAGMALMMLTSETGANQVGANMDAMAERTGAVDTAFERMDSGVAATTAKIVAKIKTFALGVGEQFQSLGPLFTAFGPTMGKLLGAGIGAAGGFLVKAIPGLFAGMLPMLTGQAAIAGTATGAAQGNAQAAAMTGPGMITRIVAAIAAIAIPGAAAGTTVGSVIGGAISAAVAFMLTPAGWIAAIVAVLAVLIYNEDIRNTVFELGGKIVQFLIDGLIMVGGMIADTLAALVQQGIDLILQIVGTGISMLIEPIRALVDIINTATGGALQGLLDEIDKFQDGLGDWGRRTEETAQEAGANYDEFARVSGAALHEAGAHFDEFATTTERTAQQTAGTVRTFTDHIGADYDEMALRSNNAALVGESAADRQEQALADLATASGMSKDEITEAWKASGQSLDEFATTIRDEVKAKLLQAVRDAAWAGAETPRAYAEGVASGYAEPVSAMDKLKDLMKKTLSPVQKEAELIGIATSKRLAKGMADERPEVRGEAQQITLDTIRELHKLNPKSEHIGHLSMQLLASATASERPALKAALDLILGAAEGKLDGLEGIGSKAGAALAASLARAISSKARAVQQEVNGLANRVKSGLLLRSPAKEGPWSEEGGPIEWLKRAASRMWGGFIEKTKAAGPALGAAIGKLAGIVQTGIGGELALAPVGVSLLPSSGAVLGRHVAGLNIGPRTGFALDDRATAGVVEKHYHLEVNGDIRAHDEASVVTSLRRLEALGA